MKPQQNLRVWIGVKKFTRCIYKSKWKMPYHIHYEWTGTIQSYVGQKATRCRTDCDTKEWKYRLGDSVHELIDNMKS